MKYQTISGLFESALHLTMCRYIYCQMTAFGGENNFGNFYLQEEGGKEEKKHNNGNYH